MVCLNSSWPNLYQYISYVFGHVMIYFDTLGFKLQQDDKESTDLQNR